MSNVNWNLRGGEVLLATMKIEHFGDNCNFFTVLTALKIQIETDIYKEVLLFTGTLKGTESQKKSSQRFSNMFEFSRGYLISWSSFHSFFEIFAALFTFQFSWVYNCFVTLALCTWRYYTSNIWANYLTSNFGWFDTFLVCFWGNGGFVGFCLTVTDEMSQKRLYSISHSESGAKLLNECSTVGRLCAMI